MKLVHVVSVVGALCAVFTTGMANAQEAAPVTTVDEGGHASGFMVQGRLQAQGGLLSLGGGPGFLLGYQGQSFALGVGLGLTRLGLSGDDGNLDASVSLIGRILLCRINAKDCGRRAFVLLAGVS